jgi:hypothetical protein
MREVFHPKSWVGLFMEVVLIGLSVFLALTAEQWRVRREHQKDGEASLRYIQEEVMVNREAVKKARQYHEELSQKIQRFVESNGPKTRQAFDETVHFAGVQPVTFERTAWDLAVAGQSLSYLKPPLAYAISRVYTRQQELQTIQNTFLQSALTPSSLATQDASSLANVTLAYLVDVNIQEPALLQLYDQLLLQIDGSSRNQSALR